MMNCKYCDALLEEGSTLCPACGKDNAGEAPVVPEIPQDTTPETAPQAAPAQKNTWKIVTAIVCAVIVALGVAAGIYLSGRGQQPQDPTSTTGSYQADDIRFKGSYTGEDAVVQAAADTVVATVGDYTLTNGQLQIYYWMQYYDFVNNYGTYASAMGLDLSKPLDEQACPAAADYTWQQYFLETALKGWQRYQVLNVMAQDAKFQLSENLSSYFDELPATLATTATQAGFASPEEMLWADMGKGCSLEDYLRYMRLYYTGYGYFAQEYDAIDPSDAEVEEYFNQNQGTLEEQGITKESGKLYDVRHILIQPEGGTTEGSTTTYSEEEWDACLRKAQDLLDQWLAGGASEEEFAALANQYSTDGGSNTNGGLYSSLTSSTNFVTEFKDWYLDENRKNGDYGLIKTSYGYHIMYFSNSVEQWFTYAKSSLISDTMNKRISDTAEGYPLTVHYDRIVLGLPYTAEADTTPTTAPTTAQ